MQDLNLTTKTAKSQSRETMQAMTDRRKTDMVLHLDNLKIFNQA